MNVVFIFSDRHTAEFTGCYGNAITRTPSLDGLAQRGVRFDAAYCLSPTCVPARASMMSGRYMHEIGAWCNSFPYRGVPRGWGHTFQERGVSYTIIGKLDLASDIDDGIEEVRLSSYRESRDVLTLFREDIQPRHAYVRGFCDTGPAGDLKAYATDIAVAEDAVKWIEGERPTDRPWVLSVNFKQLHRPWLPTQDLWDYYDPLVKAEDLDERYTEDMDHLHPFHQAFSKYSGGHLVDLEDVRRGLVGYHAAVEVLDRNIGRVLDALDQAGIEEETLVVYSSDHGGNCGEHRCLDHGGLYEESNRVPLIVSGPGVQANGVEKDPVSVLDIFPTICEAVGLQQPVDKLGTSLLGLVQGNADAAKPNFALCQYHATGFPGSGFALRMGSYKYVECVGDRPMLFDLESDPHEMHDLVVENLEDVQVQQVLRVMRSSLCQFVSPEAVDARVKVDQKALRTQMADSGLLFDELWRRGYERNADCLIAREDFIFKPEERRSVRGV
ncbi:MAG: sulfatase-like hydrolase/transferase [Candidatus Latescibacteria bacterium]|nr:sulfatase-like hydrolase/transferase [Candidatus Latescibacterota bacterium]